MSDINFENLVQEAIKNIRDDRDSTNELLKDLKTYMVSGSDRHKEVGFTLAKYLEVLQRSNEQLVKIAALSKKDTDGSNLSINERDLIFDELNKKNSVNPKNKNSGIKIPSVNKNNAK